MENINAQGMHYKDLNARIRQSAETKVTVEGCVGQRYIGSALGGKQLDIKGTPGNALGAYLDGAHITVHGNAQDATGDTMNEGTIVIHGSSGDATGYGMRGGKIFIKGDAGYRAGIHMKAYEDKLPVLMIGGRAGSFLGEYQAGGVIIVLGLGAGNRPPIGYFCGTGMHGGKIFLRTDCAPEGLPGQVVARRAQSIDEIKPYIKEFCAVFGIDAQEICAGSFYELMPDSANPYTQLYTHI